MGGALLCAWWGVTLAHSGESKKIKYSHSAQSRKQKKDLHLHPCNTLQGIQIPSKHSAAIGVETYKHTQQGLLNLQHIQQGA